MKRILSTLTEKWPDYILEIIVITIGILGAFALNNWNDQRKLQNSEIVLLQNLRSELEGNFDQWDYVFQRHKIRQSLIHSLLNDTLEDYSPERLDLMMDSATWNFTFNPSQSVYNSIITTGKLDLISNDQLRMRIGNLGDLTTDYLEEETLLMKFSQANLEPLIASAYPLRPASYDRSSTEKEGLYRLQLATARSMKYRNVLKLIDAIW